MVWPFAKRGARVASTLPSVDEAQPLESFLVNDAVLKIWLPAKLSERVEWLSVHHGSSRPDVLRSLLFEHVYGRVAMRQLEAFARTRREALGLPEVMFSNRPTSDEPDGARKARPVNLEMLGKSSDDFKLHLPRRLKDDISALAKAHGISPSHYIRKALVLMLMGERFHTDWQVALGKLGS